MNNPINGIDENNIAINTFHQLYFSFNSFLKNFLVKQYVSINPIKYINNYIFYFFILQTYKKFLTYAS